MTNLPILYSFRRCPYAIRSRLALMVSRQAVELREVVLREKPDDMLARSPKGTVPVLIQTDGTVLEESLDIALWALSKHDPVEWLPAPDSPARVQMLALIERFDGAFKTHLDQYKYATRYAPEGVDAAEFSRQHREAAMEFVLELEERLANQPYLFGNRQSFADIAIAPFLRQFANTDAHWFASQPCPNVQRWLADFVASNLFINVMEKYPQWQSGMPGVAFPPKRPISQEL